MTWDETKTRSGVKMLKAWMNVALASGSKQQEKFVATLEKHGKGIVTYFRLRVRNGFVEHINLKIQEIKRLARGYWFRYNFKAMIYFHLGGLDLGLPTTDDR